MPTLIVPGIQIDAPKVEDPRLARFGVSVRTECAVQVQAAGRGGDAVVEVRDAADDDLVELRYAGGAAEWLRVDTLAARVGGSDRGEAAPGTVHVSPTFAAAAAPGARGAVEIVLEGLQLLKIDPVDDLAGLAAKELVRRMEDRFEREPGLYRLDARGQRVGRVTEVLPAGEAPYLVFIHGTFLKNGSSFGRLYGTPEWRRLQEHYHDRILAFEHHTLSESPASNALALAQLLPAGARLHLVTHSRGGLVGELLGLSCLPEEALLRFGGDRETGADDTAALRAVARLVRERQVRIERFVRVACPARGTVLVSERLDRYLSLLLNLIGLIPALEASEVYPFAKAVILALIKQRAKPELIPGLEAMMPDSPFVGLLNDPGLSTDADLAVVAGDIEGHGPFGRLVVLAADLFFREDHDLVVDTDSMYEGLPRQGSVYHSFQRGPQIHHMAYFGNEVSRQRIAGWLMRKGDETVPGFEVIAREAVTELGVGVARSTAADKPVVFLIPGLMATHLKVGDERTWLSRASLAAGGLRKLAITEGAGQDGVSTDGIVPEPYQDLVDYLQSGFQVIPFPYDWRRSLQEAGKKLAAGVDEQLAGSDQPVHILAHSVGGLVARAMIVGDPEVWARMCQRGGRLLMLGTPNRGTYAALQLLTGDARLVRMLGLLDPSRSHEAVAGVLRTLPGLIELLPEGPALAEWAASWWRSDEFQRQLRRARAVQASLAAAADPAHMCYVAGMAQRTPADIRIDPEGNLVFLGIDEGDGVAPHALSMPGSVPVWYMDAAHGDLAAHRPAFEALQELLLHGRTGALPAVPPRRGSGAVYTQGTAAPLLFPTERDLVAAAVGRAELSRAAREVFPLRIRVSHGDLANASHPVVVGHYEGDIIVGAESVLDRQMDGALTRRYEMSLYAGKVGTAELVLASPDHHPPGAMVVGLGPIGDITPEGLTLGVTEAALRLALAAIDRPVNRDTGTSWRSAAFTATLVATQGGRALSPEGSIAAIVKGALLANRVLRERELWDRVRIDEVEFIELYQDIATHAARVVRDIQDYMRVVLEDQERLEPAVRLQPVAGGFPQHVGTFYDGGWWRRLSITGGGSDESAPAPDTLRFLLLTDRARAEKYMQVTERGHVDLLVAEMILKTYDRQLPVTLYEMLMPNALKDQAYEVADLQLVLDREAAQYPWEMLEERGQGPIATRMGVLRQLEIPDFRERVQRSRRRRALVIGEPDLNDPRFPRLAGAREEAEAVAVLLQEHGYEVLSLIGPNATTMTILNALHNGEYRIVHIAGHGWYSKDPLKSGVVIGSDSYLTAASIQQLRVVPDLVFLNCCHLARLDQPQEAQPWNKLAASVSEALIKIGVRAVIAAGWAVSDKAAQFFAEKFYRLMLADQGLQFGKAVFKARQQTYEKYSANSNTWGAYQCYGDPSFTLVQQGRGSADEPLVPVAAHEVLRELKEIEGKARKLKAGDAEARDFHLARVRTLDRTMSADWRNGEMLYRLAATYGELAAFEEAIEYYRQAIASPKFQEEVPLAAVEQCANLEVRLALSLHQRIQSRRQAGAQHAKQDAADESRRKELFEDAIKRLRWLLKAAETPERLALLGGCYKRRVIASSGQEQEAALKQGARWYQAAHAMSLQSGKLNPYHIQNWVAFRIFATRVGQKAIRRELLPLVERSKAAVLVEIPEQKRDFWDRVSLADGEVLRALIGGNLDQRLPEIQQMYEHEFGQAISPRQRNSVLQHFDFLIAAAGWRGETDEGQTWRALASLLQQLHDALAK